MSVRERALRGRTFELANAEADLATMNEARRMVRTGLMAAIITCGSFCCKNTAFAQTTPNGDSTPPVFRLPDGARPLHYDLTLTVVPGEAKASGEIAIDVELSRPHAVLWLNADSLTISSASVNAPQIRVGILSGHDQFVGLAFEPP